MDTLKIIAKVHLDLGSDGQMELVTADENKNKVHWYVAYMSSTYVCSETDQSAKLDDYRKQCVWRH
ncbi:MAG: hypothetical protein OXE77_10845 [Flavobacteriaceae bacterium]|nr:hypothetical protein [Flavobacteriaceae bacterium]MCY4268278.1 hypothetical protein [Flavobacteriaceae bacterium]MCY4298504.1 hypothetical protein [Flavobacteriaceae bacterium]